MKIPVSPRSTSASPNPPFSPEEARERLRQWRLRPQKGLGQHFLVDRAVLDKIVACAEIEPEDTIIEVGPGLGTLTEELARRAGRVIAVELDRKLVSRLARTLGRLANVTILQANILELDPATLLSSPGGPPPAYKVVANLPYYITSPVLRHFLEASLKPRCLVVMVQKEVAESIVAGPGDMSVLGISVQFYGKPRLVASVPSASFYPPPKVDSALLRIDVYPQPAVAVAEAASFFATVQAGFAAPRKQLRNSLALGLGLAPEEAIRRLQAAGIDPQRRAESLSLEEWAELCKVCLKRLAPEKS